MFCAVSFLKNVGRVNDLRNVFTELNDVIKALFEVHLNNYSFVLQFSQKKSDDSFGKIWNPEVFEFGLSKIWPMAKPKLPHHSIAQYAS